MRMTMPLIEFLLEEEMVPKHRTFLSRYSLLLTNHDDIVLIADGSGRRKACCSGQMSVLVGHCHTSADRSCRKAGNSKHGAHCCKSVSYGWGALSRDLFMEREEKKEFKSVMNSTCDLRPFLR